MKANFWTIAAAALAFAGPVQAGVNDPEVIIYRFPGVLERGGGINVGQATAFNCTNFSGVTENIRIVIRINDGQLIGNQLYPINHLATLTATTHSTALFPNGTVVMLGAAGTSVQQGTAAIAATSINIICTAMIVDASSSNPNGIALRGIRFAPAPGSQE